jgi:glycosyltransferase involved in cell wall biosynthesis
VKILFISNLFPDESDPAHGHHNAEFVRQLAQRWDVRIMALRPRLGGPGKLDLRSCEADRAQKPVYVSVPYLPKVGPGAIPGLYVWGLRKAFAELVAEWRPDVVMAAWLYPDACAVARLCEAHGLPLVAIAQGSDVHENLAHPKRARAILNLVDHQAKAVITRGHDLGERLMAAGAGSREVFSVRNGVDHKVFHPAEDRVAVRRQLGLPGKAPVVLFVGNFLPEKDPRTLAAAYEIVSHAFPDVIFGFCGDGPLRRQVAKDMDHAEILGHCRFEGSVPRGKVAQWMQAADVLAMASLSEGTPTVIMEAMSCGTPIAATAVGDVPEVVCEQRLGRTVPPGDPDALATAIVALLTDTPDRGYVAEYATEFQWETTLDDVTEILQGVIG